jgi:hypothetical protein
MLKTGQIYCNTVSKQVYLILEEYNTVPKRWTACYLNHPTGPMTISNWQEAAVIRDMSQYTLIGTIRDLDIDSFLAEKLDV